MVSTYRTLASLWLCTSRETGSTWTCRKNPNRFKQQLTFRWLFLALAKRVQTQFSEGADW